TAWCSYQSAAWTRQSNRLMNEFNALERKAGLLSLQGIQQATIHTTMFMQMLAAQQAGNEKLANFYVERFPPDARKAYDTWLAERPFEKSKRRSASFCAETLRSAGNARRRRGERESCKHAKDSAKRRQHFRSVSRERCPVCHSAF